MATEAGRGEHHYYLLKLDSTNLQDTAVVEPRKHYLGVDAVCWYVNKQGNFLSDRMASGTVQLKVADESYEVGLGTYNLDANARIAPIFDQPVLSNRVFPGGRITLRVFIRAIQQDTLLGELLRDMSKASLDIAAGAIASATAAGPLAILLTAGVSLTGGVKKILNEGKKAITIFDPNGINITLDPTSLKGPNNYLLIHRGENLVRGQLKLTSDHQGYIKVMYFGDQLDDGAWILLRLRREDEYGRPRPWEREARTVRGELDNLIDLWSMGGINQEKVQIQLVPGGMEPPNLADQILSVVAKIRADYVLAERETIRKASQLRSLLVLAQKACHDNQPQVYIEERNNMEANLRVGLAPSPPITEIFTSEARRTANARSLHLASPTPELIEGALWRTLRYVRGI